MLLILVSFSLCDILRYQQYIDHSSPELGTFSQKFYFNKTTLGDDPVRSLIVHINGKEKIDQSLLFSGPIHEIAQRTHSILFSLEHRYFGESTVFRDLTSENLSFLSVDQAIDDIYAFVKYIKGAFCGSKATADDDGGQDGCRVALLGEGYAGSLCVWTKQQYPGLIDSVWASSAPLNASADCSSIDTHHVALLALHSPMCSRNVSASLNQIENIFQKGNETEVADVYKRFNVPENMARGSFLYAVANLVYDLLDRDENKQSLVNFCADASFGSLHNRVAEALLSLDKTIEFYDPSWPNKSDDTSMAERRSWTYLMCHELGWIPVSPPAGIQARLLQRSIDSKFVSEEICEKLFNKPMISKSARNHFNERHGERAPKVSSVVYTRGIAQTWSDLNYKKKGDETREIVSLAFADIKGSPMMNPKEEMKESQDLVKARKDAVETMVEFLGFNSSCSGRHGRALMHACICNEGWGDKQCEKRVNLNFYRTMKATAVAVPTLIMFIVGIIAWITFVEPSKDSKLKQII